MLGFTKMFLKEINNEPADQGGNSHHRYNFAYLCEDILFIQHGLNGGSF